MTIIQKYRTNLNCGSCVAAVKSQLDNDPTIRRWSVDTADPKKILTIEGENASTERIERAVAAAGFKILGKIEEAPLTAGEKSMLATYWPLLLVGAYLIGFVSLVEATTGEFDGMRAMANFMGGFFVVFSFFKLLDLQGFADSFQSYDVVARPVRAYAYAYPFIELAIGIAFLIHLAPFATNLITLSVMLVGIVGVSRALLQNRRIQCACLGTVFNLPMSKVTLVEDGLMGGMAIIMLINL